MKIHPRLSGLIIFVPIGILGGILNRAFGINDLYAIGIPCLISIVPCIILYNYFDKKYYSEKKESIENINKLKNKEKKNE